MDNQQLRARLYAIKKLMPMYPDYVKFLQNGAVPPECREDFEILKKEAFRVMKQNKVDNTKPLTFLELCSFSTWFQVYPEKVAGKEVFKTSRAFPVSIRGTKDDILKAIGLTLDKDKGKPKTTKKKEAAASQKEVYFSFTASDIFVYDSNSSKLIETGRNDGITLLRLLKKYPNFTGRVEIYTRLVNYHSDIPLKTKLGIFKNDVDSIPNFPGSKSLVFPNHENVNDYIRKFGDRALTPISHTKLVLKSGEEYFWTNKTEWDYSKYNTAPIIYKKLPTKEERLRIAKVKAEAKLKLLKLLKI